MFVSHKHMQLGSAFQEVSSVSKIPTFPQQNSPMFIYMPFVRTVLVARLLRTTYKVNNPWMDKIRKSHIRLTNWHRQVKNSCLNSNLLVQWWNKQTNHT